MGFNCKWERSLRCGNHALGSLQVPHLYLEQTIQQISFMTRMLHNPDTQKIMENILDVYQLHIGLENDILAKPEECKYSDSCWIKELTTAMSRFHIKIYRKNGIKLTPQRQNDITIMQLVKSQCNATKCRHINTCRQYLNAIFVSDIIHPYEKNR